MIEDDVPNDPPGGGPSCPSWGTSLPGGLPDCCTCAPSCMYALFAKRALQALWSGSWPRSGNLFRFSGRRDPNSESLCRLKVAKKIGEAISTEAWVSRARPELAVTSTASISHVTTVHGRALRACTAVYSVSCTRVVTARARIWE